MLPIIIAKAARIPQEQIEFIVFAAILISAIATIIQIRKQGRLVLVICSLWGLQGLI